MMKSVRLSITTTGNAGSAAGSATATIQGRIYALYCNYHASAPAGTTDLTVTTEDPVSTTVYSKTNSVTDVWVYPRVQVTDNTNTGLTYDGTRKVMECYPVCGTIKAAIAQSNALTDCCVVDVFFLE